MYRSHNCGELRIKHVGQEVKLSGWIHKIRDKGSLIWIDLRDRYGITQIIVDTNESSKSIVEQVKKVGREYVISVKGTVKERESKNPNIGTGAAFLNFVEYYYMFGWVGIIIFSGILGFIFKKLWIWINIHKEEPLAIIIYILNVIYIYMVIKQMFYKF